ncbi:hypothetical protein DV735_g5240, partial [Chaetothyriales sp. CBS 134920]
MPSIPHEKSAEHANKRDSNAAEPVVPRATRVRNRRKRYLDLNADTYFGPHLELADPLLYDRLIRRFQSAEEREAEGRLKGYTGVLEADLYRSEAKLAALRYPYTGTLFTYRRGPNGEILAAESDDDDFDYDAVDNNDQYDDRALEEQEAQDRYFDEQEPEFVLSDAGPGGSKPQQLQGETGFQDF